MGQRIRFWENICGIGRPGYSEDWIGVRMLGETGSLALWSDLGVIQYRVKYFGSLTPDYMKLFGSTTDKRSEARFRF